MDQSVRYFDLELYPMQSHHQEEIESFFPLKQASTSQTLRCRLKEIRICFICFTNRVGSNLLTSLLFQSGLGIRVAEEDFNGASVKEASRQNNLDTFDAYLLHLLSITERNGTALFKIGAAQLLWLANRGFIEEAFSHAQFIFVQRRDKLAQAVSLFLMNQTGSHISSIDRGANVDFNAEGIARELQWITSNEQMFAYFFALHSISAANLYYEDLVTDPCGTVALIGDLLDVKDEDWFTPAQVSIASVPFQSQFSAANREFIAQMKSGFCFSPPITSVEL